MGERRGDARRRDGRAASRREDRAALETLADQVALALETVARAREKADAEKRHVRDLFSRFVPEAVVEEVLAQADGARLGGRALDGTIMFTDLRGFTSFSESRPADEVITVINRILSEQTETIMAHGGTIIAYLGDGLMAAFGAPIEQPDHADRARRRRARAGRHDAAGAQRVDARAGLRRRLPHGRRAEQRQLHLGQRRPRAPPRVHGDRRRLQHRLADRGADEGDAAQLLFSDATLAALTTRPDDLVDFGESAIRGRQARAELWSLESISDA